MVMVGGRTAWWWWTLALAGSANAATAAAAASAAPILAVSLMTLLSVLLSDSGCMVRANRMVADPRPEGKPPTGRGFSRRAPGGDHRQARRQPTCRGFRLRAAVEPRSQACHRGRAADNLPDLVRVVVLRVRDYRTRPQAAAALVQDERVVREVVAQCVVAQHVPAVRGDRAPRLEVVGEVHDPSDTSRTIHRARSEVRAVRVAGTQHHMPA